MKLTLSYYSWESGCLWFALRTFWAGKRSKIQKLNELWIAHHRGSLRGWSPKMEHPKGHRKYLGRFNKRSINQQSESQLMMFWQLQLRYPCNTIAKVRKPFMHPNKCSVGVLDNIDAAIGCDHHHQENQPGWLAMGGIGSGKEGAILDKVWWQIECQRMITQLEKRFDMV